MEKIKVIDFIPYIQMSPKYTLDSIDWAKVGKGMLIALIGTLGTIAIQLASSIEWGMWSPVVGALLSVLTNILTKYFSGPVKPVVIEQAQ